MTCEILGHCGCEHGGNQCAPVAIGVFHEYDTDEDHLITTTEFAYIYAAHCHDCEKTVDDLFEEYDSDHDHKLGPEEFIQLYCNEIIGKEETEPLVVEDLFHEYDVNHNELVCVDELATAYDHYCHDCGYDLEGIVAHYNNGHGDGCLCLREFEEMMCYLTGVCPEED